MCDTQQLKEDLKNLLEFECEDKYIKGDILIKSAINILKNCPSSRSAVLIFFGHLFDDLIQKFINDSTPNNNPRIYGRLMRLFESSLETKHVTKDLKSPDTLGITNSDTSITPMSPPIDNFQVEMSETKNDIDMDAIIDKYVRWIDSSLTELVKERECSQLIIDWSLIFMSNLSAKYVVHDLVPLPNVNPIFVFHKTIKFWIKCPVIRLLLDLIMIPSFDPLTKISYELIIKKLIDHSPGSDWICAHLITSLPPEADSSLFSLCIQTLLQGKAQQTSVTNILSYISEHNPQAIINASRFNIPFLLRLCSNSKPLLNLMAIEAVKRVNISLLNDLSATLTEDLRGPTLECILNAPNAYDLLRLLLDACSRSDANEIVRSEALSLLEKLVWRVHEMVYSASTSFPILDILRVNVDALIDHAINHSTNTLKRFEIRLIQLLCIHFGIEFTSSVFHQMLSQLSINLECYTIVSPPNPILVNLIRYLKLPFGTQVYSCFEKAIELSTDDDAKFWANLLPLVDSDDSLELDIDILALTFSKHMQNGHFDHRLFYILRLILCCVGKNPKLVSIPKHHLCISLISAYMKILDLIDKDGNELELIMHMITTIQKLMSHLSKGQTSNQHILCRSLIEIELKKGKNAPMNDYKVMSNGTLLKENLQYGNASKFRKLSLNCRKRSEYNNKPTASQPLRQQMLVDAVKCSIVDTQSFALLLVECLTPDVMFNSTPWPDEDLLKVTIERDLHIAKKFESNPVLWDFCELVARSGCLHYCSVLISALMAVQLKKCVAATANSPKERHDSTKRLISLIASSELVPNVPFKYLPQIIPLLTPWEISCVLNDLWRYMKENSPTTLKTSSQTSIKQYLERLWIISAQKLPGPLFVKIFKGLS